MIFDECAERSVMFRAVAAHTEMGALATVGVARRGRLVFVFNYRVVASTPLLWCRRSPTIVVAVPKGTGLHVVIRWGFSTLLIGGRGDRAVRNSDGVVMEDIKAALMKSKPIGVI